MLATIHFMRSEREPMVARLQDTLRFSRSSDQRRWAARQLADYEMKDDKAKKEISP